MAATGALDALNNRDLTVGKGLTSGPSSPTSPPLGGSVPKRGPTRDGSALVLQNKGGFYCVKHLGGGSSHAGAQRGLSTRSLAWMMELTQSENCATGAKPSG